MPREHTGGGNKQEDVQEMEAQESLAAEKVRRVGLRQHIPSEMFSLTFLHCSYANSLVLHGILISGLDYLPGIRIPTPDPFFYKAHYICINNILLCTWNHH